jgi:hypothetical protein
MRIIGIVLVVLGVLALIYGGISYSRNRPVLQVGSVSVTATEQKSFRVPAIVGAVALAGGVALLVVGKRGARPL